ncbi:MAG: lamin tail domain-containing protein [Bacteroidota bacterium]
MEQNFKPLRFRILLFSAFTTLSFFTNGQNCENLFFSEYVSGTGNNKAIEIYNPTNSSINLEGYEIQRWANGEASATDILQLEGTIPALGTWVVVNGQTEDIDLGTFISPACDPALQALADQLDNPFPAPTYLNGNDALVLVNLNPSPQVLDVFGKPGEDPGGSWTSDNGTVSTSLQTLIRKSQVSEGLSLPPLEFDPSVEWIPLGTDNWSNLGVHESICDNCDLSFDPFDEVLSFCSSGTATLVAGAGFTSYVWSTGESSSTIDISISGFYSVSVIDDGGCSATDSVYADLLSVNILESDTFIFPGQPLFLNALATNPSFSLSSDCNDLFFSEILVGAGTNRAIEIFNPTNSSIDLEGYEIQRWANGEASATDILQLEGTIPALGTWVVVNGQTEDIDLGTFISPACDPALQALADQLDNPFPSPLYMTGNDALVLVNTNSSITVVDIFGRPGENPGEGWADSTGTLVTTNSTLRRKFEVIGGVTVPPLEFSPLLEWEVFESDDWSDLRNHNNVCSEPVLDSGEIEFLWSTGDSTSTIQVNPTENTTYTVMVSNGLSTCFDSINVSVECSVEGGTLSVLTPLNEFCVGDGNPNIIQVEVSGNAGLGRYGLANADNFDLLGGNSTGVFNFENYPPGNYLVGFVSYAEPEFFSGTQNVSDFQGCFDVSNLISVSTYEAVGGEISSNQETTFCRDEAPNIVQFTVQNESGLNSRWAILDQGFNQVILSNQTGVFNIQSLDAGVYRVVHASFGDEIAIAQVNPQQLPNCIDISNTINLILLDCGKVGLNLNKLDGQNEFLLEFKSTREEMIKVDLYNSSGILVKSIFTGTSEANNTKNVQFTTSGLAKGFYILQLSTPNRSFTEKLIVSF